MNRRIAQAGPGKPTVLIIDDDPASVQVLLDILGSDEYEVRGHTDPSAALAQVRCLRPQVVILDLVLPGVSGMDLLERILEIDSTVDVILLTGHYSTDSAVEAIQRGACDYLTKPVSPGRLTQRVARSLADAVDRSRLLRLDSELAGISQFESIVGRSAMMLDLFSKMKRIAPHFQTALVTGDTGTGKELVARALHNLSPVAQQPYVTCNCAALTESLFESELFGHVKGAFTGATHDKPGLVDQARGGTLFLDEIGEMPSPTQVKLLRLIQNREVQKLGSPVPRKIDVRIIAATHRNLAGLVSAKDFRQDLYYRLSSIQLRLPALIERPDDLPVLRQHFLRMYSERYGKPELRLSRRAEAILSRHTWPGNVRELENVISHACMMAEDNTIEPRHLPELSGSPTPASGDSTLKSLKEMQEQHVRAVLDFSGGNIMQAAKILGVSRATVYRMLPSLSQLN